MESLRGQLLIASPRIVDPNFHRTVVLMAEHGEEGAMGLVLNRPAETTVEQVVGDLAWLVADDAEPIWVGGPVAADGVIVVAEFEDPAQAAVVIEGDLGLVPATVEDHDAFAGGLRRTRVFAGHAGWGAGQLEAELEEESWIVEPARREDVFTADAEGLWSSVLRRKGREYVLLSTMPEDPSLN
jgi:putative transcriptional regulator